jgi:N-acetylmuramoyl-L-alanine amidase
LLVIAAQSQARVHRSSAWANNQFATATHLQEKLESQPVAQRTRKDYERVIAAYQRVYDESPTSSKADPSVMASAELLEEMGRQFKNADVLKSAIDRYQFLRQEYPGSKARFDALFRIGEIYQQDLHERESADQTFQEFLRRYPHNPLAEQAKKNLETPVEKASIKTKEPVSAKSSKTKQAEEKQPEAEDESANANSEDVGQSDNSTESKVAHVIGIRHWSTPDYTRVAIDLDQDVKYQSQKIDNPDRIFFDLYRTKLDRSLYGKSFDIDDGFLKKIRVAQSTAERTRVVLDLDELTDYQAKLESNPSRLIIDIRNKHVGNATASKDGATAKDDAPAETPRVKTAAAKTKPEKPSCDSDDESDSACLSTRATSSENAPPDVPTKQAAPKKPNKRVVVGKNGVKKTIVDADDDDDGAATKTSAKSDTPAAEMPETTTVAKLDPPDVPRPLKASGSAKSPDTPIKSSSKKSRRKAQDDLDVREAQPTANGDRSLIRALGLKIGKIVIDPGHGGHDTGTIGPNGLEEKDLVLDVSLRLGKLLASRLGAEVVYTRKDDTFIPLEDRTAIANQEGADLFVSVHANSSQDPDARGVETYYLNFTSSPEALEVAARENAVSEKSIHELQDLLKKIALKEKIEESHEFASDVQSSLYGGLSSKNPGLRNRGVKKAPFIVLIGANMPSILAEISFVSNPSDEHKLKTPEYRQKIAESLYRGISKYVSGLSGVKVASKIDKSEGQ